MDNRTERHHEMAETSVRAHQAMTRAHIEGREPVVADSRPPGKKLVVYTPQLGEHEVEGPLFGGESGLKELRMFWKRIPDFGIQQYEIFANESGWAQVLYWGGTGEDGHEFTAQEVGVVRTDDDLRITRFEIYSDGPQWMTLVAYANDMTVEELRSMRGSYGDLMEG